MNKAYIYITSFLLVLNVIFLIYAYPFKYGKTHLKLEKGFDQMEMAPEKMAKMSDKLIEDYPDLPERVRLLIHELPSLEKERSDIFSLLFAAISSILDLYYIMGILTIAWSGYSVFHFARLSKISGPR